ncbi:hypothetical protein CQW23_12613 [Capsicum baccatum]|uniref:Uncharacterized protein n=1 Tax=Capsicum baccatum TaxID=33114 RepID=A0A2G2WT32_CAPBA|nr:hypothetical protein CQW23_12613 [Capsicum baccatum]
MDDHISATSCSEPYWHSMGLRNIRKDWSRKLDDALWAYMTVFKSPIGISPYQLLYGNGWHLPIELEHKAMWALKQVNLNWDDAINMRLGQLNEIDEFHLNAY